MKGTKLAALFVLALFVVSIVPFVAAEQGGNGPGPIAGAQEESEDTSDVTAGQVSEKQAAFEKSREELKARADQMREELKQKRETVRAEIKGARKTLQEDYQQLKEQRGELREDRKELHKEWKGKRTELKQEREQARAGLGDAKAALKDCKGSDSANCQEARKNAKVESGKFLNAASQHIIALIESAKERIQLSKLSDEEKASLTASLDADLADIDAAQQSVANIGENSTAQDLKDAAQIIKQSWGKAKNDIQDAMRAVVSTRVSGIGVQMEKLATKFDNAIAKLEAKGKDVTAAKAKQAEYQAKLDSAKALQEQAQILVTSGDRAGANEKLKAAHAELKAANDMLRGIVQEIRGLGGEKELEEAQTNETSDEAAA
jgi:chromosome segregation ATPase